ncbi:hypothetical protein SPBRAN_387 [uncultured Candidatus Thioglobus sp.]|nr:hypothetical protein SPBRAN_387 [uncultured Candidatus Thioglobus sp.]
MRPLHKVGIIIKMPLFTNLAILLKPAEARLGLALIKSPIW